MPEIHRNNDKRVCGATTRVVGQSTVYLNGELISVEGDPCSHGNGELKADTNTSKIYINGKKVVYNGSNAYPDRFRHLNPSASSGSSDAHAE
jgi:uncharacterized Zn-binding protein involved in type VI secretion